MWNINRDNGSCARGHVKIVQIVPTARFLLHTQRGVIIPAQSALQLNNINTARAAATASVYAR